MIELGQSIFGNKWESHEAPEWLSDDLYALKEIFAPDQSWWEELVNPVFDMRPYYWGDCVCGYEQREWTWSEVNDHADSCYQNEVQAAKIAAGWTPSGILSLLDPPKSQGYEKYRAVEQAIYQEACARHGLSYPNGCAVHCTCDHDRLWTEWVAENGHAETCPTILPNFLHKPSGFAVHWYKHIGRSTTCNRDLSRKEWRAILDECRESLNPRYTITESGRAMLRDARQSSPDRQQGE